MTAGTAWTLLTVQLLWAFFVPRYWPVWVQLLPAIGCGIVVLILLYASLMSQARGRKYRK